MGKEPKKDIQQQATDLATKRGNDQSFEEILLVSPHIGQIDTISVLMEVYESIEQSYRSSILAGETSPSASHSTNFL